MWQNYSEDFDSATALEMTLSGDHPCEICLSIQEERESQEKSPTAPLSENKQLRSPHFDRSSPLVTHAPRFREESTSPFGLISLLGPRTVFLDVLSPPPDRSPLS